MQNLNLLIILIKFSFVFGMPHRRHQQPGEGSSSARSDFPPPLNKSIVHAVAPIEDLDKRVSEQLKGITNNVDAGNILI
uniref:Uncharacterized protein n=1 Tax=Meloidogyne enterolobii TaxID=390850 RepID=A0A6V7TZQ0_MELEN|nr:unnamed protein product [Meloidogyne enterolobii]